MRPIWSATLEPPLLLAPRSLLFFSKAKHHPVIHFNYGFLHESWSSWKHLHNSLPFFYQEFNIFSFNVLLSTKPSSIPPLPFLLHQWSPSNALYTTLSVYFKLFYVHDCFVCVLYVHCMCPLCVQRPGEGARSPGTVVKEGGKQPCGCWEESLGSSVGKARSFNHRAVSPLPILFIFLLYFNINLFN